MRTSKPTPSQWPNLVDLLRWRADHQANQQAYTFLADGEIKTGSLTYAELDCNARKIAAELQQMNAAGERVLLLYPPGLAFIAAFLGCLYAGAIAVPANHSFHPRRPNPRLEAIANDAQAKFALTDHNLLAKVERSPVGSLNLPALQWIATDEIDNDLSDSWQEPVADPAALAMLQYTSGSTANPKGVMLTHQNLMHNLSLVQRRFGLKTDDCCVSWLPPYHDMGLIGGYLEPLFGGFPVVLMAPLDFGQQPFRWLQAISRYRGSISGGPNFAYEQCLDRIGPKQRAELDLSCWRVAFVGAEPVRYKTLEQFSSTFEQQGFSRRAFYPCYGLAEATLMVSGGLDDALPVTQPAKKTALQANQFRGTLTSDPDAQFLVGCGQAAQDQTLLIVDPDSSIPCPAGQIGEIWVSSPSVARGYWQKPVDTWQTFLAFPEFIAPDHDSQSKAGPFLRTGDLGFIYQNELFITGRLKELIIIRGLNYYPQDIEDVVEASHPALRPSCGAAFSVEADGQEQLVVVFELKRQHQQVDIEAITAAVRRAVSETFDLETYGIALIKTGHVPKTSSGKVQRRLCRGKFLENSLPVVGLSIRSQENSAREYKPQTSGADKNNDAADLDRVSTSGDIVDSAQRPGLEAKQLRQFNQMEAVVRAQLAELLNLPAARIDLQESIQSLGLGSLQAAALKFQVEDKFGIEVTPELLFEDITLGQFISKIINIVAQNHADK